MNEVEFYIDKIAKYYDVVEQSQVADKLNVSSQSLSNIKSRNSLSALRKYCLKAGIYEDIFGDSNIIISQGSHSRAAGKTYFENGKSIKSSKTIQFEELTISLIKSLIEKFGEEELQFKLMELKRNA